MLALFWCLRNHEGHNPFVPNFHSDNFNGKTNFGASYV